MTEITIPGQVNIDVQEAEAILAERARTLNVSLPSCYWILCGICMRDGKEAMLHYAKTVEIREPKKETIGILGPVQEGREKWWQQCRRYN